VKYCADNPRAHRNDLVAVLGGEERKKRKRGGGKRYTHNYEVRRGVGVEIIGRGRQEGRKRGGVLA